MINLFSKKTKILLISVFAAFALTAVLITIQTVASGAEIAELEKKSEILISQKSELESTYVKALSMGDLQEKSSEMGFVKPENLMYLGKDETVAQMR